MAACYNTRHTIAVEIFLLEKSSVWGYVLPERVDLRQVTNTYIERSFSRGNHYSHSNYVAHGKAAHPLSRPQAIIYPP